ncbi:MAG: hypothetical protein DMG72_23225 [Acidobacteria bacterium]|nr:MAG: hypothetical protein DMG72_23225 [Acidobacteriota bacterium]
MRDGKHNDNWVDLYKAALLEEDQEKLLKRTDVAVDALRNRIWVLVQELHVDHIGHSTDSGEWNALHDALRTLSVPCVMAASRSSIGGKTTAVQKTLLAARLQMTDCRSAQRRSRKARAARWKKS